MLKINLVPENVKRYLERERFLSILIVLGIITAVFLLINTGLNISYLVQINGELKNSSAVSTELTELKTRTMLDLNHLNSLVDRYNSFSTLYNSRSRFSSGLTELNRLSTENLWFDSVEYYKKGNSEIFEIRGTSTGTESITSFMKSIRHSFQSVTELKLRRSESFKSGGKGFSRFEIYLKLEIQHG